MVQYEIDSPSKINCYVLSLQKLIVLYSIYFCTVAVFRSFSAAFALNFPSRKRPGEEFLAQRVPAGCFRYLSDLDRFLHYHLHVVYIPVVEKEILWSKRCKDEALRGMVREIIHQVSRSKKWAYPEAVDEQGKPILGKNGKPIRIPSYSLLQDRFYEHMRLAGFDGFERGELGSTRVNLNSLDFKIQEDKKRLIQLEKLVAAKEMKLEQVSEKLVAQKQVNKQYHDLDGIGKKTVFGKIELTEKDYTDVISLAREGILSRVKISELTQKLQDAGARILDLQSSWERLYEQTKDFRQAIKLAPQRVKEVFTEIFAKDRETRELQRILRRSAKKRNEYER